MRVPHRVRLRAHALALLACGLCAVLVPLALTLAWPAGLEPVELWTVDLRFRLRPPLPVAADAAQAKSDAVAVIDYDDVAAKAFGLGRWPWDRRVHAEVLDWLREAGAKTVVVDLLLDREGTPDEDEALDAAVRRAGTVLLPVLVRPAAEAEARPAIPGAATRFLLKARVAGDGVLPGAGDAVWPLPRLLGGSAGVGHVQRTTDVDGVLRHIPLVYATPEGFVPALAFAAALRHLDADVSSLEVTRGKALSFALRDGRTVTVPLDAQGRAWINYAGPWGQRFTHYPYSWLRQEIGQDGGRASLPDWFRGKTVVLNNQTTASGDQGPVPFERDFPFGEVHAHLLNMLLTQQFLRDACPVERAVAWGLPSALLTLAALAGGPAVIVPAFGAIALGAAMLAQHAMSGHGVIVPVVGPMLALTLALVLLLAARFFLVDRDRRRFLAVLGATLPPHTVREIEQSPDLIPTLLTGRRRELTILFADMKGFSAFCLTADPLEIQRVLREYRTVLTRTLREFGGTLEKYTGDEIMGFFGDAEPDGGGDEAEEARVERHAANAVRAALAIQRRLGELNERWREQGRAQHQVRIGLTTGPVTIGNFGTDEVWQYGIVGSEVNRGKRLEGAAPSGGILLARRTYALARKAGALPDDLPPAQVALKGFGEEEVYAMSPEAMAKCTMPTAQRPGL